jgi:hypothetical protein
LVMVGWLLEFSALGSEGAENEMEALEDPLDSKTRLEYDNHATITQDL